MPLNMHAMARLREQSDAFAGSLDVLVRERGEARGAWSAYLKEAKLNDFERHLVEATPRVLTRVSWPTALLGPSLAFVVEYLPGVLGVTNLEVRLAFVWHQDDHTVVSVDHGLGLAPLRHDLERFLAIPLEEQVEAHLTTLFNDVRMSLVPAPPQQ